MGSSTADVVATIRAVADSFDISLLRGEIAKIAVAAEYAIDPVFSSSNRPVELFAH